MYPLVDCVMKTKFIYLICICYLFSYYTLRAQGIVRFYNLCTDSIIFNSLDYTNYTDSNVIFTAGDTYSPGITNLNAYVATFNYNLNLLHKKEIYFPGMYTEILVNIGPCMASNVSLITKVGKNKYMLAGAEDDDFINTPSIHVFHPFFYFFNSDLDSLLAVKFTDSLQSRLPYSVTCDKNKNILVAGYISSPTVHQNPGDTTWYFDSTGAWIAKYDSNAHLIWEKSMYNNTYFDNSYVDKIVLAKDSLSYIIAGIKLDQNNSTFDYFVTKLDSNGNVIWQNSSPVLEFLTDYTDITPLKDGGYAFINSYPDSFANGGYNRHAFNYGKITETGDTAWTKRYRQGTYGGPGKRIMEAENGDLLLYGETDTAYLIAPTIFRTDSNGNIKNMREYAFIDTQFIGKRPMSVSYTPTHQILITGGLNTVFVDTIPYQQDGFMSMYVLTDTFSCLDKGCQLDDSVWQNVKIPVINYTTQFNIYPNPNSGSFTIIGSNINAEAYIDIINCVGQAIYQNTMMPLNGRVHQQVDIHFIPPGIYLVRLTTQHSSQIVKMIITQ